MKDDTRDEFLPFLKTAWAALSLCVVANMAAAQAPPDPASHRCNTGGVNPSATATATGAATRRAAAVAAVSTREPLAGARGSTLISSRPVDGMVLSTGNVYFTSHDASGAQVFRTGHTSSPGQEIRIYCEDPGSRFGDIVWAQVGGVYYGYFWATRDGKSYIKRIPLTGSQSADTLTPAISDIDIVNSHRNLATNGSSLFWQQSTTVNQMPIAGGPILVLVRTNPNTPTAGVYLRRNHLVYADGATMLHVLTNSPFQIAPDLRTIVKAKGRITTMALATNGNFWGDVGEAVRVQAGDTITTIQPAGGGVPTSIGRSGASVGGDMFWTSCTGPTCRATFTVTGGTWTQPIGANALGATMTTAGKAFWGDADGLHRQF